VDALSLQLQQQATATQVGPAAVVRTSPDLF
jgi:hypothetical protein